MSRARTLCLLLLALAVAPTHRAGADGGAGADVGLRPDLSLARPDPYRPLPSRFASDLYQFPLEPRESLVDFEVDTLDQRLVYQAVRADGTRLGLAIVDREADLLDRLQAANRRALGLGLADAALKGKTAGKDHIEIDIPFKVKSKTFRRIFGSGRIGLNVHGNISIKGTYRAEKRESESASAFNNNQNDFRLEQQQQFTVVGKVGEKVNVHIDQNTERSFDFENSLSIVYTGEPEEIIESISAGNISLSLPSTKYVSFSDQSSGLFGLKMVNRFGPLRLTGIASTEKNESKQQTFTGTASEKERELGPGEHVTNFFFLNEYYRHQYRVFDPSWNHVVDSRLRVLALDLYEFDPSPTEGVELRLLDPAGNVLNDGALYRMKKTSWSPPASDPVFTLDPDLGILQIKNPENNRFIAVGYTVGSPAALQTWFAQHGQYGTTIATGTLNATTGSDVVVAYPNHFNPEAQPYWDLQLRNIFSLGTPDMEATDFGLEVGKVVSGGRNQTSQNGTDYLAVLYLDVNDVSRNGPGNDRRVDERWIEKETGSVWFPSPYPFGSRPEGLVLQTGGDNALADSLGPLYAGLRIAPNASTTQGGLLDRTVLFDDTELDALYDLKGQYRSQNPDALWHDLNLRYRLNSTAQVGTEVISLGWNVTNVTVTANNRRLIRDTDYTLDEQAGLIRIINPAYQTKDQRIQVNYETPQLFQLRKKTFAGLTAELDLWESGRDKSKLGAAWIYFNEETAERKVRLGNEPIKNVVMDLNARLVFQPRLMTEWMDALPLIEADEPSRLDVEAEYAMIIPDPNPSNNPDTGDNSGVAYVDDFESSKQEIPLSLGHTQWFLSSRPEHELLGLRGWMGWYNPRAKVPSREIWPDYQESDREGVSNEVRVLRLEYQPFRLAGMDGSGADTSLAGEPLARGRSWGGLYYDFRGAYDDLSDKKFIELTLKVDGDHSGRLNLDLGVISEDVVPNNLLDTEDLQPWDYLLQENEDTGLDRMNGRDPPWPLPDELFAWSGTREDQAAQLAAFGVTSLEQTFDWWDLDGDGRRDPHEPWSFDDWVRAESAGARVDKSHGWEGNSEDADQIYPDTEDRNGNLNLDNTNSYFSYSVPLNPADPLYSDYVFENSETDWVFVRIPLSDDRAAVEGNPQLTLVNGLRVWLTGFTDSVRVTLAELNIVGNEWRKAVIADSDTSGYDVTVLNNYDNSDFYYSPPGAAGQKDLVTGVEAREQSLVMELEALPFGGTAWVRKQLAATINLAEYRELKMFVHGGAGQEEDTTLFRLTFGDDKLEYHLRLLSTENDYYEYSKFIRAGWDAANNLHILFGEITGIDQFTGAERGREEPGKPVPLSDGGQVLVVGNPSITRVRSMLLGVTNHGSAPARTQVWFNELRVSNVKKEISRAMRAEVTAKFSDVATVSSNYERKDADYHTVKERAAREGSAFKENASASFDTNLGRLLPPALGLTATLSLNASSNLQVPKYYPNDDQEVDLEDHPAWVETFTRSRSASLSLRKSTQKGWWLQQTLDKTNLTTDVSQTVGRNVNTEADTSFTQNVRVNYSNNFKWTHTLKPFAFARDWPLLGKPAGLEIGYFPQSLGFGASSSRRISHTWKRDLSQSHVETYTLSRNWTTSFKPLKSLSVNLQRSYENNLKFRRAQARLPLDLAPENPNFAASEDFKARLAVWREQEAALTDGDHTIRQSVGFTWAPTLVSWTSTSFGYNTTYNWTRDLVEPARGLSLGNSGKFTADFKLEPAKLARRVLLMSDTRYDAAKKKVDARRAARTKEVEARRKEKEQRREERRQAREAGKAAGAAPAPGDTLAVPGPQPGAGEDREPGGDGDKEMEAPVAPVAPAPVGPDHRDTPAGLPEARRGGDPQVLPPAPPADRDTLGAVRASPAGGDSLRAVSQAGSAEDSLRARILTPQPLLADSLLGLLPDSLRLQLAAADSLIKAQAARAPDSLERAARPGPAAPDTAAVRGPNPILLAAKSLLTRVWEGLALAGAKLEPIDIKFGRDGNRTDPGLALYPWTPVSQRHATLGYQLALDRDPGFGTLRIANMTFNTSRSFGYDYGLDTRVNLHKELPLRLGYDYTFSQQFTNNRENSRRETLTGWYVFSNDPPFGKGDLGKGDRLGANPTLRALPDYSFSLRRLNRLKPLGKAFKDLNLNHDYKGRLDVTYSPGASGMYRSQLNHSRDFNPLAGFDFQMDKGWGGSASYKVTRRLKVNDPDGGNRSMSLDLTRAVTLSAQKMLKGLQLPGFKKRLKNDTTLRLTYDNTRQLVLNSTADTQAEEPALIWNTPQNKRSWSLTLTADYKFSRNMTGGGSLKYGVERSGTANDKKSYMEFQMNCRVEIRSR